MPRSGDLHIISWNVAGLKNTTDRLKRFGFKDFLKRHGVDILCLQEVKLPTKTLTTEGRQFEAEGFESYWACNDGLGEQRQGLNGVCTFARKGLVVQADNAPLQCQDLDAEGRCLLTDHGAFVVFNVYVPNSAGGVRLPFKMRWLQALQEAMVRQRSKGKTVILAGDLNLKHRVEDSHWSHLPIRPACLEHILEGGASNGDAQLQAELQAASRHWVELLGRFRAKQVVQIETRNSRTGQVYQRWGAFARPVPDASGLTGDAVRIGNPCDWREMAECSFLVDGVGVEQDGSIVMGPGACSASYLLREPGEISLGELAEGLKKLAGVDLGARARDWIVRNWTTPNCAPAVRSWLQGILKEGLVDTFAELYPKAQERFTCWDQYRNKRHENDGARIDYILVDRPFFEKHASAGAGLDCRGVKDSDSPLAAHAAATLGGILQPAPFEGGGMPAMDEDTYLAHFRADREGPSSGIIYTPPQLSDHVAVSLFLKGVPLPDQPATPARDAATQRCQPHLSAKRITDFFAVRKENGMPPAKRQAVAS